MNEKPKSIWKKSWSGRRGLFCGWLILMAALAVIFLIWLVAERMPLNKSGEELGLFVVAGIGMTAIFLLASAVRWIFHWRNFKKFLFGLVCFATLIALFYAEEDWRGWHAWNQFKSQWEAKGEKFDFKDFIPSPVPDDQNFALTPIVFSSYGKMLTRDGKEIPADKRDEHFVNRLDMPIVLNYADEPTGGGTWEKAKLTDLKPWQDYYRRLAAKTNFFPVAPEPQTPAQDVLTSLSKYDSTIEELRAASKLLYSRFPIDYGKDEPATILLPHLATMKNCVRILRLRATAELQDGQSQKALDDIKLMLYLNQSIRTEPIFISHLVRIAMSAIALEPIYEGLAQHKWSDTQLAELDAELAKLDFLADYEFSMRGEMIFGISETEYLRRSRNFQALDYSENGSHNSSASHLGFRLAPASFFYRNELTIGQMHERWTLPIVDITNRTVSPKKVDQSTAAADKALQHGWPYNILARMIFPATGKAVTQYAREQSSINLARTAITLERYHLAHGNYPDSLDALAPQFIQEVPHDVIGGGPLHYRRTDDGQFVLYSVGWNETDDGGVVVFMGRDRNPRDEYNPPVDINKGDWVWRYPQK